MGPYIMDVFLLESDNMYEEYLDFAVDIAKNAGKVMKNYFDSGYYSEQYKEDNTIVTKADKEINDYLIEMVKKTYPEHSVDGEENGFGKSSYVWVCDPIDGTAMYSRHLPVSVFSLALVIDGVSTVGVVYDPFNDSLYTAVKDGKAYCNGREIHVSDISLEDKRSVAHHDMWPNAEYNIYDVIKELGKKTYFVGIGSIIRAGTLVAEGNFSLALFPGTDHKNCDIAALKVIVEAAGGKVTDFFGNEQRYDESINGAVISNGIVHDEVISVLKKHLNK